MEEKGFTLVEAIIALTVFSFIVFTVALLYANANRSYARNSQLVDVQENLRISLNKIARDLREATGELNVSRKVDGAWKVVEEGEEGTQISYKDSEDNLVAYRFDEKDNEVEVKRGQNDTFHPIASQIKNLEFSFDEEERIVTIKIQGEKGISGTVEMTTRLYLRAYQ
ncbi:prepilin-type cleavage/methylation domain containing protein [Thermacetogenium phaeum DSM 12270]|uniref:Prepilin-type cleavage/methylation domain containing protein n=1 Tax=Thermacetogenium phaeum (strain ATCC BAA-254 / DSM 26808 / PB) TaxID=1089553 RepID=K4LV14_THEPS|nr:prepilin-type N-terminal cleavage/methylation domain-containing protein [Thermacetogenium phaeum]AFV11864.1 prepilin-type cleavage/methylation domain containing protein [Thermacetogenium phaeum DSM 12270]